VDVTTLDDILGGAEAECAPERRAEDKRLLDRLSRVEGQVRGLRKMLEEGRACEEVVTQLMAVRSGLESAGLLIIDRHLQDCLLSDPAVTPVALGEVRKLLRLWGRAS
jgi:DNA-binding FrmR family transcriptional regulator